MTYSRTFKGKFEVLDGSDASAGSMSDILSSLSPTFATDKVMDDAYRALRASNPELSDRLNSFIRDNNDLKFAAMREIEALSDLNARQAEAMKAAEALLEVSTFTPWLREWCRRRFGKWITHNTAKGALNDLRAALNQENSNAG